MRVSVTPLALLCISAGAAAVIGNFGQKETPDHGGRSPHERFSDEHFAGGEHDKEKDHEAILGSRKQAHEFDALKPEESKRRLRQLAAKMDTNSDGVVSKEELTAWIVESMKSLDDEEAVERFDDMDENDDMKISWDEYVADAFGDSDEQADMDESDKSLMAEDKLYFKSADADKDGFLTQAEFRAFHVPENHPHMHESLVQNTLQAKDKNGDGAIDFAEFVDDQGESYKRPDADWYQSEKERFEGDYDQNKDGVLDRDEMKRWLVPDLRDVAVDEMEHLFGETDDDKNGELSFDEITSHHDIWVGSEATNFGEHLENPGKIEL